MKTGFVSNEYLKKTLSADGNTLEWRASVYSDNSLHWTVFDIFQTGQFGIVTLILLLPMATHSKWHNGNVLIFLVA